MNKERGSLLFFIALFFVSLILPIATVFPAAAANPTATWTSNGSPAQIAFNGKVFTQQSITNGSTTIMMRLTAPGACSSSPDLIEVGLGNLSPNNDYHTATQALTFTFPSSCQFAGNGVATDLTNTFNNLTGNPGSNTYQGAWVDSVTINVFGVSGDTQHTYGGSLKTAQVDSTGNVMTLTGPKVGNDCSPEVITVGDSTNSYMTATTAALTIVQFIENPASPNHGSCQTSTNAITLANPYISVGTTGHWTPSAVDPDASIIIDNVGADANAFLKVGDTYLESGKNPISGQDMTLLFPSTCKGVTDNTMHVNPYTTAANATVSASRDNGHGCANATLSVALTNIYGSDSTGPPTTNPISGNDGCNVPTTEGLRWIECPVISSLQFATTGVNGLMSSLLEVSPAEFFNSGTQNVFNIFRNIAVAFLVIAGLVMVVSQAADLEFFAAHTVRKTLPRIVIAAILISLSWPLLQFVIGFFNDMGAWTGKIILSVADALPGGNNGFDAGNFAANIGDSLILGLVAAGGVVFLGAAGIILLLVSFLLLGVVVVFVLMARQIVIFICFVTAPVGFAFYAIPLPGTEKIGRFWKDTFVTALVMFPLIEGFLAAGAALAFIIMSIKSGNYFYHIMAVIVYLAPYFAVPLAFRIAGGLVGRIAEFAQGTHHQTIESKLQGFRQGLTAKNWNAVRTGSRYNPDHPATNWLGGRGVNFVGRHIGAGIRGRLGIGPRGQAAMANNMALGADAASKMDSNFAAQMNNEDAMASIAFGNNRAALERLTVFRGPGNRARLDAALAAGRTVQATQQMQMAAADALARSGKVLENRAELDVLLDSVSHGNEALRGSLKGSYQYTSRQVGRADLGRDNFDDAFKELDMPGIIRQKPKALENLFGNASRSPTRRAPIVEAIGTAQGQAAARRAVGDAQGEERYANQAQHYADLLYAVQFSPSLSAEQQGFVKGAIDQVNAINPTLWTNARSNYQAKIQNPQAPQNPGGPPPSDCRLKTDITYVCTRPDGIKLYRYRYRWGGPRYIGVMAQDLLQSHPKAVIMDPDGYYRVDYARLGITLLELEN